MAADDEVTTEPIQPPPPASSPPPSPEPRRPRARKPHRTQQQQGQQGAGSLPVVDALTALPLLSATPESQKAALTHAHGLKTLAGRLVKVPCPVYEGLSAWYRVNNKYWVAEMLPALHFSPDEENMKACCTLLSLFVWDFEGWDMHNADETPIPKPNPAEPLSYRALLVEDQTLFYWLIWEGYRQAKEGILGNSGGG